VESLKTINKTHDKQIEEIEGTCHICGIEDDPTSVPPAEITEARKPKFEKVKNKPSQAEVEEHELTHMPYRSWCDHCVRGKAESGFHRTEDDEDGEIPVVSMDYTFPGVGEDSEEAEGEEKGMPIIVIYDKRSKATFASVVPKKGKNAYAIKRVGSDLKWLGYRRIVFKTDQEFSITALKGKVSQETMKELRDGLQMDVYGEMVMEESPVHESQSNGGIENAIKRWQGQLRAMLDALIAKYGKTIEKTHCILPWLVRYASTVMNRYGVGDDGKTCYERLKGKRFRNPVAEFGECIWYLKPGTKGVEKLYSRWETGIFAGIRDESGEVIVCTKDGTIKVRSFRRKASKEQRWNLEELEKIKELLGNPSQEEKELN